MDSARDCEDVCITPLGPEHADDLSRLVQRLRGTCCQAITASAMTGWIAGGFIGDRLHGFVEVQNLEDPCLWRASVLVEPAWRGLGLETGLLQAVISFAKASGRTTLRLAFPRRDWPMRKLVSKANARFDMILDELSADISLLTEFSGSDLHQKGKHHD
jgi:GNAT superfamily N-acetyltransferase